MKNLMLTSIVIVLMSTITYASEYIVDPNESLGDYSTIQTAIIASSDGDTITVNPGTYTENINMMNKAITLQSTEPTNPTVVLATIIEGNGESSIVCTSGEDSNTLITGFLITKSNSADWGGGICNFSSSPTVTNCTFSGNSADGSGGGICNFSSSPTVTNCTFSGNSATSLGGGILNADSSPIVTNCTFSGNSADGGGGGMYNDYSSPTVTNCTFSGNSADWGGGIFILDSSPTVTNCTFSGNSAEEGGGICNFSSSPTVTNCTFSGNSATYLGGGILNADSSPTVTNCTFSGNSAGWSGGGMYNAHSLLTDSMFNGDSATYSGEIYNYTPLTTVSGCTFSGNSATVSGGGIYNDSSPSLTLTNSYLCLNTLDAIGGDGYTNGGGNNLQFCPPPKSIVEGDLTDDNKVDFEDFAILAANWLEGTE